VGSELASVSGLSTVSLARSMGARIAALAGAEEVLV
jgi:hypothetical protein